MAVKKAVAEAAKEVFNESKELAQEVSKNFDDDIDTWLVRWAKSPFSGWIACGFGVALLVIGFVVGKVF